MNHMKQQRILLLQADDTQTFFFLIKPISNTNTMNILINTWSLIIKLIKIKMQDERNVNKLLAEEIYFFCHVFSPD